MSGFQQQLDLIPMPTFGSVGDTILVEAPREKPGLARLAARNQEQGERLFGSSGTLSPTSPRTPARAISPRSA